MNDPVERQAVLDTIRAMETYKLFEGDDTLLIDKAEAQTELRKLPSAQPEPKWIPVTKKAHPDLPIRVQVQMDNGWIITAYYQEGEWLSVPDCGEPLLDNWIEAWRELPEPWKGEKYERK